MLYKLCLLLVYNKYSMADDAYDKYIYIFTD